MEPITLKSVFESNKHQLADSLKGLSLSLDSEKVQSTKTSRFNVLFDEKSNYRENLTQSEDYILQSVQFQ